MSPVVPLSLQIVNFNVFHPGCGWSGKSYSNGGCLSIAGKINLSSVSNWSSVSSKEYMVVKGKISLL